MRRKGTRAFRRRVRLSQLELLAAFHRASTLSAAAREVNLSQPAASRMLRILAEDLGVALFERAGRTLHPTPAGRALLRRAASFVGELERAQDELDAIGKGLAGSAMIGAGVGACYALVPRALSLLRKARPEIVVSVREEPIEELVAKLSERRIDLIVARIGTPTLPRDTVVEALYDPPTRIICGPQHPLARMRRVDWPLVLQQEWIVPAAGTPMRAGLETIFRRHGGRPQRCLTESSSIPTNVCLLNQHDMLSVLSADIAEYFSDLGVLRSLNLPVIAGPSPIVMAYLSSQAEAPVVRRLMDCLRSAGRTLTETSSAFEKTARTARRLVARQARARRELRQDL
ncbi:MAG TPA: LysR family transcriptional regulator [Xanthobacteraceae bacterium]|nr:LysR family transcriptional regulator [Xanthobacteraceae bacterium]